MLWPHVDVVAADLAQQLGNAGVDFVGLAAVQRAHVAHQAAITLGLHVFAEIAGQLAEMRFGAVGEDRVDGAHVVHHVAVADRARAAGIVGGHAADRRAVAGRDIDREPELVLAQAGVEPLHDDPGLNLDAARPVVERDHALHVFAALDDEGAVDRLAALRGAAAARQHRDAFLAGDLDRRGDVILILGDDDPQRLDLVDRGVGRIAPAGEPVEQHIAFDLAAQTFFQSRDWWRIEGHGQTRLGRRTIPAPGTRRKNYRTGWERSHLKSFLLLTF